MLYTLLRKKLAHKTSIINCYICAQRDSRNSCKGDNVYRTSVYLSNVYCTGRSLFLITVCSILVHLTNVFLHFRTVTVYPEEDRYFRKLSPLAFHTLGRKIKHFSRKKTDKRIHDKTLISQQVLYIPRL